MRTNENKEKKSLKKFSHKKKKISIIKDTMISSRLKYITTPIFIFLIFLAIPSWVECGSNKKSSTPVQPIEHEPTIEEVSAKQLEKILAEKDYVAVYWCKLLPSIY